MCDSLFLLLNLLTQEFLLAFKTGQVLHFVRLLPHVELLLHDELNLRSQFNFGLSKVVEQFFLDVDLVHHFPCELLRAQPVLNEHVVDHEQRLLVLCDRVGLGGLVRLAHRSDHLQGGAEQVLEGRFSLLKLAVARQPLLLLLLELVVEGDPLIDQRLHLQQAASDPLQSSLQLLCWQLASLDLLFLGLELTPHVVDGFVDV